MLKLLAWALLGTVVMIREPAWSAGLVYEDEGISVRQSGETDLSLPDGPNDLKRSETRDSGSTL